LAVATGKSIAMARGALQACGQIGRFGAVVGCDEVERPKPHPDTALRALELLGVVPEQALVVGDSVLDIEMGRAAGCRTCAVASGSFEASDLRASRPDFLIASLFELELEVLGRLA
jgi:AHBA synthesis associated protein